VEKLHTGGVPAGMRRACGGRHRPPKMVRESEKPSAGTSFHLRTHRAATDNNRSMRGIGARGPHQRVCRRATKGQCSVNSPRRPRQQAARACEVCSPWRGATKGASWPRGSLAKRGAAGRWVVGARKIALTSRSLTDTGDGAFSVSFRNIARPPLATTVAFGAACHAPCAWGRAPRWPPQRTRMACMGEDVLDIPCACTGGIGGVWLGIPTVQLARSIVPA
jgi:hypothetical protein